MNIVKQAKTIHIVASAVLLALGVFLLIIRPTMLLLRILMGSAFLLVGASKIFGYFSNDLYKLAFQFDLAMGILSALVGIVLLVNGNLQPQTASGIAAIYVMAESMFKLQTALDARKFGMRKWVSIFVAAIVVGAVGVFLLLNPLEEDVPESGLILMGIAFVLNASQNIWTTAYTVRVKAKKKHVEDRYESFL